MFWNTVLKGFQILFEWKIWVVIFIYSGIMYLNYTRFIKTVPLLAMQTEASVSETFRKMEAFSVTKSIVDSILVVLSVFIILPILLGAHSFSTFGQLKEAIKTIGIIILIITGARVIVSKLWKSKLSFSQGGTHITFFICVVLISFIMHRIVAELPISSTSGIYPSFWLCIGFILVSYFILLVFSFLLGLMVMPLSEESKKYVTNSILTGMSLVMGIVYMRMYCYHILEKITEIDIKWDAI